MGGTSPLPIAAIYVRQSVTDEDDHRNVSADMHEQACHKLLEGYEVRVYSDLNKSGSSTSKRTAYLEMTSHDLFLERELRESGGLAAQLSTNAAPDQPETRG